MQQKIDYLLNRFNIEWSGPAWFSVEIDKNGFPHTWMLNHFLPLNLGSHSATEWEGKQFLKKSKKLYKKNPELQKMYMGNIHSHHTMGAFFSATDNEHLQESANLVGYPSLVVASAKDTHAFAISYIDSWKVKHIVNCKNVEIENNAVINNEWVAEADNIEEKKKTNVNQNQIAIWERSYNDGGYNHYEQTYGFTYAECQKLDWEQKNIARKIVKSGNTPIIKDGKVYLQPAEDKIMSGLTDEEVKKQLDKAKGAKERYEIALDAFEGGFMDDADFQKEISLLYEKLPSNKANEILQNSDDYGYGGYIGHY